MITKNNHFKKSFFNYKSSLVAALSCTGLVLLAAALVFPSVPEETNAATTTASATVGATLGSVISISAPSDPVEIALDDYSSIRTASATVTVITNNFDGYTLTMSSSSSQTALTNGSTASIGTVSDGTTVTNFPNVGWGYYTGSSSTTYNGIKASGSADTIKTTTAPSSSETKDTTITFGAKVDNTVPTGGYTNEVTFSAVANTAP